MMALGFEAHKKLPKEGLEPSCTCVRQILSLLRLPFRHFGASTLNFIGDLWNVNREVKREAGTNLIFALFRVITRIIPAWFLS
jgi:hypothetical protein